jgi:hypothetical protein
MLSSDLKDESSAYGIRWRLRCRIQYWKTRDRFHENSNNVYKC